MQKRNSVISLLAILGGFVSVFVVAIVLGILLFSYLVGLIGISTDTPLCTESYNKDCPAVCVIQDSDSDIGRCSLYFPKDDYWYLDKEGAVRQGKANGE